MPARKSAPATKSGAPPPPSIRVSSDPQRPERAPQRVQTDVPGNPTDSLDNYVRLCKLGDGVTSSVYKVEHRPSQKLYACKVIPLTEAVGDVNQIVTEYHLLNVFRHANIVQVHTARYKENSMFIIEQLVEGMTLGDHLQISPQVPENVLGRIAWFVLAGLSYLSRQHVIHRDLKPSNILLSNTGDVKIVDFGMAKVLEKSIDVAASFRGTMCYMSPERLDHGAYSLPADIWSFGVILYEAALGKFPTAGDERSLDFWALKSFAANDVTVSLPKSSYSPEFVEFVRLCLRCDPTARAKPAELEVNPWVLKFKPVDAQPALSAWIAANAEKQRQGLAAVHKVTLAELGFQAGKV
jgi:serine/threonine protein kinase